MRISDWSSDVCSSDLLSSYSSRIGEWPHKIEYSAAADRSSDGCNATERGMMALRKKETDADVCQRFFGQLSRTRKIDAQRLQRIGSACLGRSCAITVLGHRHATGEIGRASCRERVCQYV